MGKIPNLIGKSDTYSIIKIFLSNVFFSVVNYDKVIFAFFLKARYQSCDTCNRDGGNMQAKPVKSLKIGIPINLDLGCSKSFYRNFGQICSLHHSNSSNREVFEPPCIFIELQKSVLIKSRKNVFYRRENYNQPYTTVWKNVQRKSYCRTLTRCGEKMKKTVFYRNEKYINSLACIKKNWTFLKIKISSTAGGNMQAKPVKSLKI